jgi:hypothetical protein
MHTTVFFVVTAVITSDPCCLYFAQITFISITGKMLINFGDNYDLRRLLRDLTNIMDNYCFSYTSGNLFLSAVLMLQLFLHSNRKGCLKQILN